MKKLTCYCVMALSAGFASPAFAKGGLGEIFGALIGGSAGKAVGRSAASGMSVEQALVKVCDQINQLLPMAVDKETRWDNTFPGPGRRFTYNYTFVNATAREVDADFFLQAQTQQLRRGVCSSKDMEVFLKNSVTIAYSYRTRDGTHIGQIEIAPRDCGYPS